VVLTGCWWISERIVLGIAVLVFGAAWIWLQPETPRKTEFLKGYDLNLRKLRPRSEGLAIIVTTLDSIADFKDERHNIGACAISTMCHRR
jgi:hypothetical protein